MIVSLALLGTGASGTILMLIPWGREKIDQKLRLLSFGTLVSILGAYLVINEIPFDSFSITWDPKQIGYLAINFLALALPFFFTGLAVGLLLNIHSQEAEKVYAVNLVGAAVGCVLALIAPRYLGGEGVVVLSGTIAAISVLSAWQVRELPLSQKIIIVLSVGIALFGVYECSARVSREFPSIFPPLKISPYKGLSYARQYPDAEVISQEWNSYSRVDVVSSSSLRSLPGISFHYFQPPPPEHGLFIDGDNLNPIVVEGAILDFTSYLPAALVFEIQPDANTLILEPRGGLDILIATNQGAGTISIVEENPLILSNIPHIYQNPQLEIHTETDRSFLRSSDEQFDIIIRSLVDTYHPVGSGAYSLGEDYSYTREAFQDTMDRLSPEGVYVLTRWLQMPPSEWLRTFILAATALESRGGDPWQQIVALRSFNTGILFIKNSPYTPEELAAIRTFASDKAFDLVFLPDIAPEEVNKYAILEQPIYYQAFLEFLSADSRSDWLTDYPHDVSPPTDNHPFFGHYFKWSQTGQIIAELGKTWQPFGGAGYLVVLILLGLALLVSAVLIFLPLFIASRTTARLRLSSLSKGNVLAPIAYFGLIGLGYLFVEIPIFQSMILYLGQPTYALTIVLFSILLFSGVGSRLSRRFDHRKAILFLVGLVFLVLWLLPTLVDFSLGLPFPLRITITVLVLAPLGVLMGIPFPRGLHIIEGKVPELIPWVWGINGAASVLSSILAALLALSFGFKMVLVIGGLCYAGAWYLIPRLRLLR
jgi:hypothetical protein